MSGFGLTGMFAKGLPAAAGRFAGLARYNFVGGNNDPEAIPREGLAEAAAAVLRRDGKALAIYNMGTGPQGYIPLRQFVVDKLKNHRGTAITVDDVLILSGSGQGLDFINRLLIDPGDTVIIEEYSYTSSIRLAQSLGAKTLGAPLDDKGLVIDKLAAMLEDLKGKGITPKYIYTIPTIQNPTGSILPLERRKALVELARKYGVPIFEDECYADLAYDPDTPPSIYSLAPDITIHLGSFSKNLAPALRLGYLVAGWEVLSQVIAMKGDGGTGALNQMVVAEYFGKHFDDHVPALNKGLREKLEVLVESLEREFGTAVECIRPEGGIFMWIRLPEGVDTLSLVKPAAAAGVAFNPGPEWAVDSSNGRNCMRLCFAQASKQDIRDGVALLARVCYENTGIPKQSANIVRAQG